MLNEHHIMHGLFQFERVFSTWLHIAQRLIQSRHYARQSIISAGIISKCAHQAGKPIRCNRTVQSITATGAASLHRSYRVRTRAARIQLHLGLYGGSEFRLLHFDAVVNLLGGQIVQQIFGHAHQQQRRQDFDEETPDPRCHFVR